MNDILQSTPKSVDQVVIEPDGKWSQNALPVSPRRTSSSQPQNGGGDDNDGDDDIDIIEIQDVRLTSLKTEHASMTASGPKTPATKSREPSTSRSSTAKRPVIDLTLSDDDDAPPRPPKRVMNSDVLTNNALERRNGYRTHSSNSQLNSLSFQMPAGNSRSNPTSVGTPDR